MASRPAAPAGWARVPAAWSRWVTTAQCAVTGLLALLALIWLASTSQHTRLGQQVDEAGRKAVVGSEQTTRHLVGLLGDVSIGSVGFVVLVLAGFALWRREYAAVTASAVLAAGANLTTELVKQLLSRSDYGFLTVHSLPSGHTSAVASLVLAALLVAPVRARLAVSTIGAMLTCVVGSATLVAGWHRPSDVLAGLLVCLIWGCLVLGVWAVIIGGRTRPAPQPHGLLALVGVVLGSVVLFALGVRPNGGWSGLLNATVVLTVIGLTSAAVVRVFADLSAPLVGGPGPAPMTAAEWEAAYDVRDPAPSRSGASRPEPPSESPSESGPVPGSDPWAEPEPPTEPHPLVEAGPPGSSVAADAEPTVRMTWQGGRRSESRGNSGG